MTDASPRNDDQHPKENAEPADPPTSPLPIDEDAIRERAEQDDEGTASLI